MARLARVVIPGHPHHVTQRGNGRARTFFGDADDALYRDLLAENCRMAGVEVWAWCLMPNHVHLIPVPSDPDGLRGALASVHRAYAGIIQARRRRSGHFWQGRFGAVAMDEEHLAAALRYVSLNPVRARLVERAQDWRWSSTRAHLRGVIAWKRWITRLPIASPSRPVSFIIPIVACNMLRPIVASASPATRSPSA